MNVNPQFMFCNNFEKSSVLKMKIVRAEKKIVCPAEENQQGRKKNCQP